MKKLIKIFAAATAAAVATANMICYCSAADVEEAYISSWTSICTDNSGGQSNEGVTPCMYVTYSTLGQTLYLNSESVSKSGSIGNVNCLVINSGHYAMADKTLENIGEYLLCRPVLIGDATKIIYSVSAFSSSPGNTYTAEGIMTTRL